MVGGHIFKNIFTAMNSLELILWHDPHLRGWNYKDGDRRCDCIPLTEYSMYPMLVRLLTISFFLIYRHYIRVKNIALYHLQPNSACALRLIYWILTWFGSDIWWDLISRMLKSHDIGHHMKLPFINFLHFILWHLHRTEPGTWILADPEPHF